MEKACFIRVIDIGKKRNINLWKSLIGTIKSWVNWYYSWTLFQIFTFKRTSLEYLHKRRIRRRKRLYNRIKRNMAYILIIILSWSNSKNCNRIRTSKVSCGKFIKGIFFLLIIFFFIHSFNPYSSIQVSYLVYQIIWDIKIVLRKNIYRLIEIYNLKNTIHCYKEQCQHLKVIMLKTMVSEYGDIRPNNKMHIKHYFRILKNKFKILTIKMNLHLILLENF